MRTLSHALFCCLVLGLSSFALAKDPASDTPKENIASQIIGHWGVNAEKTKAAMAKQIEGTDDENEKDELAAMAAMVAEMQKQVVLEFRDDKAIAYTEDGKEPATFAIEEEDLASGKFVMLVKPDDEDEEQKLSCRLQGDDLRMTMAEALMIVHWERLGTKKAKKRIKKILEEAEADQEEEDPEEE